MYIAIAGNIGSGKTTLTEVLARHYHWEPKYEQVTFNPYLEDYYKDIHRWSFPMEVFFLKERFRDLLDMQQSSRDVIHDRSIYEGVYVFAANNKRMGNLSDRDFQTFMELFGHMTHIVRYPDHRKHGKHGKIVLFVRICNPLAGSIGICNPTTNVFIALQMLIFLACRIANPTERRFAIQL